jgi:hemerythrin-like domain-containing protein
MMPAGPLMIEHRLIEKMIKLIELEAKNIKITGTVLTQLLKLVEFYPEHITKEDKNFFIPCMQYFTRKEQDDMLNEFWEFDKKLIHEKYRKIVESYE